MARRPARPPLDTMEPDDDPVAEAVRADRQHTAADLTDVIEQMRGYDAGDIKGVLYKVPGGNGKFEWIEECHPPFNPAKMFEDLKERFGGGDFQLRIFENGRIRKNINFSIAKDRSPLVAPHKDGSDALTLMQLMMSQQAEAAREGRAASDRQMQMMMQMSQQSTQMMLGMITAVMSGREKASDFLPLLTALRPDQAPANSLKDTAETLVALKGLFNEGGGGGFDAEDMVGSAIKLAGPMLGAIGKAVSARGAPPPQEMVEYAPEPGQPLQLPGSEPLALPQAQAMSHPVLDLVRDDVLFMFKRDYDPNLAAEAVLDQLERAGVTEGHINGLVAELAATGDPWAALASYGFDFRTNLAWGEDFLTALVKLHAEPLGSDDHTAGGGGGEADPGLDGGLIEEGLAAH